jgi:hypothetical protein
MSGFDRIELATTHQINQVRDVAAMVAVAHFGGTMCTVSRDTKKLSLLTIVTMQAEAAHAPVQNWLISYSSWSYM